jgi:hypothetical protein
MSKRLYVIVRKDLPKSYRAVQAGHAVAEWLLHDQTWKNETLIYLGVQDEKELSSWVDKLDFKNIKWVGFKEPDINNELTAIATICNDGVFNKLKLL